MSISRDLPQSKLFHLTVRHSTLAMSTVMAVDVPLIFCISHDCLFMLNLKMTMMTHWQVYLQIYEISFSKSDHCILYFETLMQLQCLKKCVSLTCVFYIDAHVYVKCVWVCMCRSTFFCVCIWANISVYHALFPSIKMFSKTIQETIARSSPRRDIQSLSRRNGYVVDTFTKRTQLCRWRHHQHTFKYVCLTCVCK